MFIQNTLKNHIKSNEFKEYIETILNSAFYTSDPTEACIFIPLIDLLYVNYSNAKTFN